MTVLINFFDAVEVSRSVVTVRIQRIKNSSRIIATPVCDGCDPNSNPVMHIAVMKDEYSFSGVWNAYDHYFALDFGIYKITHGNSMLYSAATDTYDFKIIKCRKDESAKIERILNDNL